MKQNVIISIGSFSAAQVVKELRNNKTVIAYDPRKAMCKDYAEINHPNFKWFAQAVSGKPGKLTFYEHEGSSTVLPMTDCPFAIDDTYEVDVVAMSDVLLTYPEIERMTINCEGSEISIIMDTPIELLARCKDIGVEFHRFCKYLNISVEDVKKCVKKLEERFTSRVIDPTQPYMTFRRRN